MAATAVVITTPRPAPPPTRRLPLAERPTASGSTSRPAGTPATTPSTRLRPTRTPPASTSRSRGRATASPSRPRTAAVGPPSRPPGTALRRPAGTTRAATVNRPAATTRAALRPGASAQQRGGYDDRGYDQGGYGQPAGGYDQGGTTARSLAAAARRLRRPGLRPGRLRPAGRPDPTGDPAGDRAGRPTPRLAGRLTDHDARKRPPGSGWPFRLVMASSVSGDPLVFQEVGPSDGPGHPDFLKARARSTRPIAGRAQAAEKTPWRSTGTTVRHTHLDGDVHVLGEAALGQLASGDAAAYRGGHDPECWPARRAPWPPPRTAHPARRRGRPAPRRRRVGPPPTGAASRPATAPPRRSRRSGRRLCRTPGGAANARRRGALRRHAATTGRPVALAAALMAEPLGEGRTRSATTGAVLSAAGDSDHGCSALTCRRPTAAVAPTRTA